MSDTGFRDLIRVIREDRMLRASVTAAPDYPSLVRALIGLARVHDLDVNRGDIDDAVDELNRIQANPPRGTTFTPEQEAVLTSSLAGICWDFPPTTDWTNVATAGGNPCCKTIPPERE